jgi:hypothetical protein
MADSLTFRSDKELIYKTLNEAEKFIKIVVFQLTSKSIVDLLIKKSDERLDIEVITLPEDSYAKVEDRDKIRMLYDSMISKGIELNLCDWEVGDPSLTDTSLSGEMAEGGGSKWYSLHGKFIITDKCSLISSSNLSDDNLWEVYLFPDKSYNKNFQDKYNELKSLFLNKTTIAGMTGRLYNEITPEMQNNVSQLWNRTHRKNISQYPPHLSPKSKIKDGLHISPFDGRARDFLFSLIDESQDFLYLTSERVYDEDLVNYLKKKALTTDADIRIIAGHPRNVRQNPSKAESFAMELLSSGVKFLVLENVHAKFWLSEKFLMVGSPNLTKMNLGFKKTNNYWRSNTETLFFTNNSILLAQAKKEFETLMRQSEPGVSALSSGSKKLMQSKGMFDAFKAKSKEAARLTLSRVETQFGIKARSDLVLIVKESVRLAKVLRDLYVNDVHVIMALILFFLQERKHTINELKERMTLIAEPSKVTDAVDHLVRLEYCIKHDNTLMLNIEKLG